MARFNFILLAGAIFLATIPACGQALTPAWVELGEGGQAFARIVVNAPKDCPAIVVDGASVAMSLRPNMPDGFRPACEFTIPANTKTLSVNGQNLTLPKPDPARIIVLGDTGCRIKGSAIQDCNDPDKWPFQQVASAAADEKADLGIHVGDYLYRESPCPTGKNDFCGGTHVGDNWETWNEDFFAPAKKMLAATPWAFSRGNHEDCGRAWRGWFYYLDPRQWDGTCWDYSYPYAIKLGSFELMMLDSSAAQEAKHDEKQIAKFAEEIASIPLQNAWLVDHHPFWGFENADAPTSPALALTWPLEEAWDKAAPKGVDMILSGHIHVFEVISFEKGRPVQLVAGNGGTDLAAPIGKSLNGSLAAGQFVAASENSPQFGYTLITKTSRGWDLTLKNRQRQPQITCSISGGHALCHPPILLRVSKQKSLPKSPLQISATGSSRQLN
jgi:hypothetical protein